VLAARKTYATSDQVDGLHRPSGIQPCVRLYMATGAVGPPLPRRERARREPAHKFSDVIERQLHDGGSADQALVQRAVLRHGVIMPRGTDTGALAL